ncbi:MAG: NifB/NifX family molybdenum-iron cluster-binding protein [Bacteroidales bacterium]
MTNKSSKEKGFRGEGFGKGHRRDLRGFEPVSGKGILAVSAEKASRESLMDLRFGRCNYFMLYDPASGQVDFIENPGKDASGGAGPMAAQLLAGRGVCKIISGDFGPKAADALNALNIEMVTLDSKEESLESLINKFKN